MVYTHRLLPSLSFRNGAVPVASPSTAEHADMICVPSWVDGTPHIQCRNIIHHCGAAFQKLCCWPSDALLVPEARFGCIVVTGRTVLLSTSCDRPSIPKPSNCRVSDFF